MKMPPPSTSEEFLEMVVQSGLLAPDQLHPYAQYAGMDQSDGQRALASQLVKDRLLTPFQARQLLAGKIRGYFLGTKYKILGLIGSGGTGHVFLCEHMLLRRLVAVKLLQKAAADMTQGGVAAALERFVREARAVATLDHPNIVRVHDMERAGAIPYMVMEYVDGTSLHQIVAQGGPLPCARAAHYISQTAAGLQHAHENGLIHRDIKPGNLLLDRTGIVKMLDLGLARFLRDTAHDVTARFQDHAIVGTVDYMSPEQAVNSPAVDIRADIYSLGATFYYLLAGRPPFDGDIIAQKLIGHQLHNPPPLESLRPEVPRALSEIVARMVAKKPADRFQTPEQVVAALTPWTRAPIPSPPPSEMPRLAPQAYRLGLTTGPDSEESSYASSAGKWEFPLAPDSGERAIDTPHASPDPTSRTKRRFLQTGSSLFQIPPLPTGSVTGPKSIFQEPTAPIEQEHHAGDEYVPTSRAFLKQPLFWLVAAVMLASGGVWTYYSWPTKIPPRPPSVAVPLPATPGPVPSVPKSNVILTGSGSTFVRPAMERWSALYNEQTGVTIKYTGTGSGRGVENMLDGASDFGCTDAYLSNEKLEKVRKEKGDVIHIPLAMGAVVATYNLPQLKTQLRLTGQVLADIYLGEITEWDHEAIAFLNPDAKLPKLKISVVRRNDNSGTTHIFTDYLYTARGEIWKERVGVGSDVKWWKDSIGAEKNEGVADLVSKQNGAIGYVELSFALERNLKFAMIKNAAGVFVSPSLESVTNAANALLEKIPDDFRYSLVNAPGERSYPICGTTWAVLFKNQSRDVGTDLVRFLRWTVNDGQKYLKALRYAPLPDSLVTRVNAKLDTITCSNKK
jgi:phosphate ABC transporter phosphate-binding protein